MERVIKNKHRQHLKCGGFLPWLPNIKRTQPTTNKLAKCVCGKWTGWLPEEVHSTIPAFDDVVYEILPKAFPVARDSDGVQPFKHNVTVVEPPLQEQQTRICLKLPTGELYTFSRPSPVPFIVNQWAEMLKAEIVKVNGHLVWIPEEES